MADDKPEPLTFKLADFERVLALWDCKLTETVVHLDGPPSILGYPLVKRGLFAPNGQRMTIQYTERAVESFRESYGDDADHYMVEGALDMVRDELNGVGFYGPSPKQTLAMIRMRETLESIRDDETRDGWSRKISREVLESVDSTLGL